MTDTRSFAATLLLAILLGCASQETKNKPASAVKPIDRVREGIVGLTSDLKRTMVSAQSMANNARSARSSYSQDLRKTEQRVETLRTDAAELRDRASDYLAVWGGDTFVITGDSHARGTDTRRDAAKAKYDQLVSALMSAKEIVLPLLDRFKAIEASRDPVTIGEDVQIAESDGTQAIHALDVALSRLDELKAMLQTKGD
jgi:hypothetical protein